MFSKLWFRAGATALLGFALSTTIAVTQDHDHGYDRHDRDEDRDRDHDHGHAYGHEKHEHDRGHDWDHHYAEHDRDLHDWYRAHYSHLPPGLAKRDHLAPGLAAQLVVSGTLPVELRSRMQPCPHEVEAFLPPPPPDHVHVFIGGNLVLVNRVNFQIVDVFHFNLN